MKIKIYCQIIIIKIVYKNKYDTISYNNMEKQNKTKILLVDDDEMMRVYFRDIFWIHGGDDKYDVSMASSIKEAEGLMINQDTRPDIVFLDMMMPIEGENNGPDVQIKRTLSFVEKMKNDNNLSKIKIIIHSSQKENFIKEEVCKLGVDGYLVKGDLMPKEIIDFTDKLHESNH